MTESHFIRGKNESKWCRASEFVDDKIIRRVTSKGPVFAVELDTDDYLTLRGGIQAATFGNCLIVEPHRQGYTHDFRSKIDQALRVKGLHKADLIEWSHGAVGHRADGSLLLETGLIKTPPITRGEPGDTSTARATYLTQQRSYRVCGSCHKPEAKLKCTCLSIYYCDANCQRADLPVHRLVCTDMVHKEITLIRRQILKHKADHGQFTMEVARLELILTETHVKLGDLLRTSGRGIHQQGSEEHYLQALTAAIRLKQQVFLVERPSLHYHLRTDQAASHLGLGCLYRDQHLLDKASEQFTQAHVLIQELILIKDSPDLQELLGVTFTVHGEVLSRLALLHAPGQRRTRDSRVALEKQQTAVRIFSQLECSSRGPLLNTIRYKLMATWTSMADTLDTLELHAESKTAIAEARAIGHRASGEDSTCQLHRQQSIDASTKHTMDARRDLDDHTPTLHIGSKIRLHGLINQAMNGRLGTVLGDAKNNRFGIQLQGEQRQISIQIINLRYRDEPAQDSLTLYRKVVAQALREIELRRAKLQTLLDELGNRHIDTARAQFQLGSALWLSNKPLETHQAVQLFDSAIRFMTQHEPNNQILTATKTIRDEALGALEKFDTKDTLSAWPYWRPPTAHWEDERDLKLLFRELRAMSGRASDPTITSSSMSWGLHRYGLHEFDGPTPPLIDQDTFIQIACAEIDKMKKTTLNPPTPRPTPPTPVTKPQSSPSLAGNDT